MATKPRLLVFGTLSIPSGTARVTSSLLAQLADTWEIHCCAAHWLGDSAYPSPYPYAVYRADLAGPDDPYGVRRYQAFVTHLEPNCVLVIGDIPVVRQYLTAHSKLPAWPQMERPPIVAYVPVRGMGSPDTVYLNECTLVLTPTVWGAQQLRRDGYKGPLTVLAPGVDLALFTPRPRDEARAHFGMEALAKPDTWIVGNIHKNMPQQRLDVAVLGFAAWVHAQGLEDHAYLWLQCTNQGEPWAGRHGGWDIQHLARQLEIEGNLLLPQSVDIRGIAETELPWVYSAWDVAFSTAMSGGWGMGMREAQACGVPVLAPAWGGMSDASQNAIGSGAVASLPLSMPAVEPATGVLSGFVHPDTVADHLAQLIGASTERQRLREAGLALAQQECFRWPAVATQLERYLRAAMDEHVWEVNTVENR